MKKNTRLLAVLLALGLLALSLTACAASSKYVACNGMPSIFFHAPLPECLRPLYRELPLSRAETGIRHCGIRFSRDVSVL